MGHVQGRQAGGGGVVDIALLLFVVVVLLSVTGSSLVEASVHCTCVLPMAVAKPDFVVVAAVVSLCICCSVCLQLVPERVLKAWWWCMFSPTWMYGLDRA